MTTDSENIGKLLIADYHYTYKTNNGQLITIEVGDEYILIKKSNADWWQVIKLDQKKPFYVPAAYMKELNKHVYPDHPFFKKAFAKLQKEKKKHRLSDHSKLESERQSPVLAREKEYSAGSKENLSDLSSKSKLSMLRASSDSLDRFIENENPYDEVPFESKVSRPDKDNKKTVAKKSLEDPEYENLENIQSYISQSRTHASPTAERKENESARQSRDQQSTNKETKPQNVVHYANVGEVHPRIPSSTTVEVFDDGWELQLDHQSNSRYYLNRLTGEMRVKPPRRSANSPTIAVKPLIKKVSANKVVPPAPPDVSKKPTLHRSNITPQIAEPSSPLERRKTSPARIDGNSDLPEVLDDRQDVALDPTATDFTKSKSLLKPSHIEPLKDKSSDGIERRRSFKERFFPDSDKKKSKHKKANSDSSSHSLSKSASPSPHTSPKVSKGVITPPQRRSLEWLTETNQDGSVIYIRKSTGERWQQMLDSNSGNFYYFNESSHETSWKLPELESRDDTSYPVDTNKTEVTEDDLALIKKSKLPFDHRNRKASTIERDTLPSSLKEVDNVPHSASLPFDSVPPKVAIKPRGFKAQANRVMIARSMIILPDGKSNRYPFEDSPQFDKSRNRRTLEHSSPPPHPLIERKGKLNCTKFMEAGKKQRKNWVQQFVVLIGNNLLFYKDEKQATMSKTAPHGKPESSCELRGATVDWATEKSSKKNVIELQTVRGLWLLLQHEDQSTVHRWLDVIKASIARANQVGDDLVFSNPPLIIDEEDEHDSKKKKDKKKKKPTRHSSDAKNNDNVRSRLKKFISRRPTIESLQERGIIKETVFGCPLDHLCKREGSTVPQFVKMCVEEVERRGLDVDGIYRVSGNLSHVQKLRYLIDRDESIDLGEIQWDDIHLITGALKMFLRELPEPVIPFNFFDKFITACKIQNNNERIEAMRALVSVLPRENGDTLRYLMEHFCKVVQHSSKNRMQVQNIAIVFGPTLLLKPPDETHVELPGGSHMHVYMVYQNQILDEMLTQYERVFG